MRNASFRRNLTKVLCGTLLSAGLIAQAQVANAGSLSIGHTTWVGYGTMYLARDLGYFKQEGLDIDLPTIEENPMSMAAMGSGKLSGVAATPDSLMKYRSPNFCFKSVVVLDDSHGGDGLLVDPSIKSWADLKGKEVALNENSSSRFLLAYMLKQHGLQLSDVKMQNMTADAAATAFMAKRVPVAVTWEPNLTMVKQHGYGRVLEDSTQAPGVVVDVIVLRCDVIEKQPKDVQALVDGIYKAVAYEKANPEKSYAIMAKGVGGYLADPKSMADATKGVRFYDKAMNKEELGTAAKPGPIADLLALGTKMWQAADPTTKPVTYDMMIDPSFATK